MACSIGYNFPKFSHHSEISRGWLELIIQAMPIWVILLATPMQLATEYCRRDQHIIADMTQTAQILKSYSQVIMVMIQESAMNQYCTCNGYCFMLY